MPSTNHLGVFPFHKTTGFFCPFRKPRFLFFVPRSAGFSCPFRESWVSLVPSKNRGVPHISLVFREMWETTNLNLFSDLKKTHVERCGLPRFLEGTKRNLILSLTGKFAGACVVAQPHCPQRAVPCLGDDQF